MGRIGDDVGEAEAAARTVVLTPTPDPPSESEASRDSSPSAPTVILTPAAAQAPDQPARTPEAPLGAGSIVGRYVVLSQLGAGGMGVVYAAYDPELNRRVALKLMHTRTLVATAGKDRMLREAQALARLSHPNVVTIYDVGSVGNRVFLAMELVDGTTLSDWLKASKRPWREIVEMFISAGRGLAAAHAAGVIHRDFKQGNVLVGKDGRARVMDFGLARADQTGPDEPAPSPDLSSELSRDLLSAELTVTGMLIGTPMYMPPEAHRGELPSEAGDQFSFCVALYTALYGQPPFPPELPSEDPKRWIVREPRGAVPRWIGDLVMRGLALDPHQRHRSMTALIDALGRDPLRKRIALASVVLLVAAGGGVLGVRQLDRRHTIAACEDEGTAIASVWNDARADAIAKAFDATGIKYAGETWQRARISLASYATAWQQTRTAVCKREAVEHSLPAPLARASRVCLDEQRADLDALVSQFAAPDAAIVPRAATVSASLPLVTACTDLNRLRHQPEPPTDLVTRASVDVLRARLAVAVAANTLGRSADALARAQEVIDGATRVKWPALVLDAKLAAGEAQRGLGAFAEARTLLEEAYFAAASAGRDDTALDAATRLGLIVGVDEKKREGTLWVRHAQMLAERLGHTDDLPAARVATTTARVELALGETAHARELLERAISIEQRVLGMSSPRLAVTLDTLANVQHTAGNFDKALELSERALAIRELVYGPNHPEVATSLGNLATIYGARLDAPKSLELHRQALALREKLYGPDHPDVALALVSLANVLGASGSYTESVELAQRAYAIYVKRLGPEHPSVGKTTGILAKAHFALHNYKEAVEFGEQAVALQQRSLGPDHPDLAMPLNELAFAYGKIGEPARGIEAATRAQDIWRKKYGADHFAVAIAQLTIASMHTQLRDYKTAMLEASEASRMIEKKFGLDHPAMSEVLKVIGEIQFAQGQYAAARESYEREVKLRPPILMPAEDIADAQMRLADAIWRSGGDRARAIELATWANTTYAGLGAQAQAELKRTTEWLATHKR